MATLSRAPHPDLPGIVVSLTEVGADPKCVPGAPCDMLRAAIARHGGVIDWTVNHTGWVVTLYLLMEGMFSGGTLEDGLRSCLAWLVTSGKRDAQGCR